MKKVNVTVGLCCLALLLFFLRSQEDPAVESASNAATVSDAGELSVGAPTARHSIQAQKGDASTGETEQAPQTDFTRGELQNLVIDDGLHLGDNSAFKPRFEPFNFFGAYISPEETAAEPFNIIMADFEVIEVADSKFTIEIRSKSLDGDWSIWDELATEPNKPFRLSQPAIAWQYRLTLFANSPQSSPKVRNVSITTKRSTAADFSANNGTNG